MNFGVAFALLVVLASPKPDASLPTTLVADRTLARVAAARRIETATEAEQLKLALDYGLLTTRTNLLVVHERAEGEKAKDLPGLAKVLQMHAAGWHGLGSVLGESVEMSLQRDYPDTQIQFCAILPSDQIARSTPVREARAPNLTYFEHFLGSVASLHSGRLPRSIRDLERIGLPADILDDLRFLVAGGNAEADVVRAFFDAVGALLADGTIDVKVSRQLARALRRVFAEPQECAPLRENVRALLQAAMSEAAASP